MFLSNLLSALQAPEQLKGNHTLLIQIQDMLDNIEIDQKEVVLYMGSWTCGY